ncbi:MAG: glycosyltransferase family 4 protein [Bacteroidia bacterium]|nr:glycosyltransferase family 4 protein [Bacteroidia bacterium]
MRIAIICDGVHPYVIGGMQRHTFYLTKYLSRLGVKVTLIHFNQSDLDIHKLEVFSPLERENIENIVLDFPKGDKLPGHYVRASYKYSVSCFQAIKDRIMEFDFIYTKGFSGWKLILEKRKHPEWPPVAVKFHGYEMFQKQADTKRLLQSLLLKRPVKWITLNADYVFSYGSKITDIIRNLGTKESHIIEIPAGIEKEWIRLYTPQVNSIRKFVYLGRYERRKGIEELNQAIRKLESSGLPYQFDFIGPFENHQKLPFKTVFYHGSITDNTKIRSILDTADFLVCPSWSEGMPNVILEAMARACAIIATDVGATSIMVNKNNGILIQPGKINEISNALMEAIQFSDAQILEIKLNSLELIKNELVYENILTKLLSSINQIIKK